MELHEALLLIHTNAQQHRGSNPTLGTLLEEVAELARAIEGKHDHHPSLELIQIGGIVANMLTRYTLTDAHRALNERYL